MYGENFFKVGHMKHSPKVCIVLSQCPVQKNPIVAGENS